MEVFDNDLWNYLNQPDEDPETIQFQESNPSNAEKVYWARVFCKEMVSNCCGSTMNEEQALSEKCPKCKEGFTVKLI